MNKKLEAKKDKAPAVNPVGRHTIEVPKEDYIGYVLVLKDKSTNSLRDESDLISLPLIFEKSQLEDEKFNFEDHIDTNKYEILFVQSENMLKHQLVAIRRLAKENDIELN